MFLAKKLLPFYATCVIALFSANAFAQDCTITMGYRTNERMPLINAAPDNSGLYFELYSAAAKKISCTLKVVRLPKLRILHMMQMGEIDFYPGFNFTEKRAAYAYYFDNGLPGGGDVGISRSSMVEVTNLNQLEGKVVLLSKGSPSFFDNINRIRVRRPPDLTIERAVELIRAKVADFYIYNRITIEYFRKTKGLQGMKIHLDCCGGRKPLYMAFSRNSSHFAESPNPNYESGRPMGIDNFPAKAIKTTIAHRFAQALTLLMEEGVTQALANKYYYGSGSKQSLNSQQTVPIQPIQ